MSNARYTPKKGTSTPKKPSNPEPEQAPSRLRRIADRLIKYTKRILMALGLLVVAFGIYAWATYPSPGTPLPSGANASPTLCNTYFGTADAVAAQFGVPKLTLATDSATSGVFNAGTSTTKHTNSTKGGLGCIYQIPGAGANGKSKDSLLLLITDTPITPGAATGGVTSNTNTVGSNGIYVLAESRDAAIKLSSSDWAWLQAGAERAALPTS